MEFRIRTRDIQWTALVLFVLYLVAVLCFVFNEFENHESEHQYEPKDLKLVWTGDKDDKVPAAPLWMQNVPALAAGSSTGYKYYLSAYTAPQIEFAEESHMDPARDKALLIQWIHYLLLVGVEHVYLCDCYHQPQYSLESYVAKFVNRGLLTYMSVAYNSSAGLPLQKAQARCFQYLKPEIVKDTEWLLNGNSLEYIYIKSDPTQGSLSRHLHQLTSSDPEYSDVAVSSAHVVPPTHKRSLLVERTYQAVINDQQLAPIYKPSARLGGTVKLTTSDKMMVINYKEATSISSSTPSSQKDGSIMITDLGNHFGEALRASFLHWGEGRDSLLT